ncbi:LacI family transcriptional regulator [Cnuibacter physcomitrellae]|uniref:LacI family DNA-binding transcriptional regulator n=1 Tax=Cnuibacter physcomitrellae TaxID=1619308 RepID=UPI002175E8CF|nr:LacI family DNA-binding transcriptional regulator [Cnuibacter physcomitrellae]MCS5495862.1 LacI family transcriptional regulator [Cnuibacter physcomitrellae]
MKQAPENPARRANLREVAALAGVSLSTASRVLSGSYPISGATREKVVGAMRELGYSESRTRRREATRTIGVIVPDVRSSLVSGVTAGIDAAAAENGRICTIFPTEGDLDRERDIVRLAARQRELDALVFVGGMQRVDDYSERLGDYLTMLEDVDARLVLCARPGDTGTHPAALRVGYDNEGGAFAIASYLTSKGHRRIAWVGGYRNQSTTEGRVLGVRRALASHGLELEAVYTDEFQPNVNRRVRPVDLTYANTRRLLEEHPEVTGIVANSDFHAVEVVRALHDAGVDVPGDISVVGYDDNEVALQVRPNLTTVHLPVFDLGWEAARLAVEKPLPGMPGSTIELGTHVVVRDSVAPPRA